jgi:thiol:disulfide interchange protein DsbD
VGALVVMLLIVLFGVRSFLPGIFSHAPGPGTTKTSSSGIAWKPFSEKELESLLKAGETVFVDFTADWCISCKFNERTAIDVPAVREAFAKDGIVAMKADWTNANPEITAALKRFGRVGVPFYVLYPRGKPDKPIILPELLTEKIVLDALAKARG